ncbi:MAG: hypothetical protein RL434_976, partial [Pseudomonadota bacterium]
DALPFGDFKKKRSLEWNLLAQHPLHVPVEQTRAE